MEFEVSRRDLFKLGGAATVGALGMSAFGCAPAASSGINADASNATATPEFLQVPEPITEFAETLEYDIVVVGAGESGLSAVHTAMENGARVACVQNLQTVQTTGNTSASIDPSLTSPDAYQACVSFICETSGWRADRALVNSWAQNSYEAITWWADAAAARGVESKPRHNVLNYHGYEIHFHTNTYFHTKGNHQAPALVIAEALAEEGAEFFYSTPAVQLQTENGAVTGVVCQREDESYVLFKAAKAVILCTGDYSGNREMLDYYAPDTRGFKIVSPWRDGSGMRMGMWAGAQMTPTTHTKMIHGSQTAMPFLSVDRHGKRFMPESVRMPSLNNIERRYLAADGFENPTAGRFFTIMPSNWKELVDAWFEEDPTSCTVPTASQIEKFLTADTVEELVAQMNQQVVEEGWSIDELTVEDVTATIERYNELCEKGADADFGKDARYMVPIEAPYVAASARTSTIPAILGGLIVNENGQCLDGNFQPIPGLLAAGNASGQFYGGIDYPMDIGGLSVGRAVTSGFVAGRYASTL